MRTTVVTHAALADIMARLRDESTEPGEFRARIADVATLLTGEATRDLPTSPREVITPVGTTVGQRLDPRPVVVPILRAGLGMLDAFLRLVPAAEVGFLGLKRDEKTLVPAVYMERLPDRLAGRHVFLVDPMLATGGSLVFAIDRLLARGADRITCLCVVAAPEGVAAVEHAVGDAPVDLFLAALDESLNSDGYIVPGLGDAGDRLFGLT